MKALQQVLILAASKKNYDTELKKILGFYNNERSHDFDKDILKTQLQIFSKNFPLKEQLSNIDIENYYKKIEPSSRKLLSEVGKILELVLVLPATNATSERNFSKMGLIKTPIRSTMSHERLNHCMVFSTHKEKVDDLNLTKLATKFVKKYPKRERFFAVPESVK